MLPKLQNYAVWPCVYPADVLSEVTITANGRSFLLHEGVEYQIRIEPRLADQPDAYAPTGHRKLTATAQNGILRFSHIFAGEQEHTLQLSRGDKVLQEFSVFSLKEDLMCLTPLKGDLHSHSFRSDGKCDPAYLAGVFREYGYDFFALTDHNRFYPGGEIDEIFEGMHLGIFRVLGEEVHAPGSSNHVVHIGGSRSISDLYVKNPEQYERDIAEYEAAVPASLPEAYRSRYARMKWTCDEIHRANGLAIFPHPFWCPGKRNVHHMCDELTRILLMDGMFDAYELIGAMKHVGVNRSIAMWNDLRAEGLRIPIVGSSDVHNVEKSLSFPWYFTVCFAKDRTNEGVVEAVRHGLTVAVEESGLGYEQQWRPYGTMRLVTYAQFLLRNYFPKMQQIARGEGVAMRAFAIGEADRCLAESQAAFAESFSERFFGRKPPVLPSPEILAFEEKWRKVQQDGPRTAGSRVGDDMPITYQI